MSEEKQTTVNAAAEPEPVPEPVPEKEASAEQPAAPEKPAAPVKPYYAGIDIIKIIAVFFVVSVHFFLYTGFYSVPINDEKFMAPIAHRWLVYCCVPLFMITTGYLMKNKTFNRQYFKGIIKILVIYILISIVCIRFRTLHGREEFDAFKILKSFLEYSGANYGWYINYYIGLFLVIPFLNLAFNGAKTRGQKLYLVIVVALTTVFARSLFLGFEPGNQSKAFPDYMNGAWPLTYYFTGAFIRDYSPKTFKQKRIVKLIAAAFGAGTLYYLTWSSYNHSLTNYEYDQRLLSRHYNDYSSWPVFVITACIFLLLFDIKTTNKHVKFVLRQLGDATLPLYLISYIFDAKNYYDGNIEYVTLHQKIFRFLHGGSTDSLRFNLLYDDVYERWQHCMQPIMRNFLSALFWALIINNLYHLCEHLIQKGISLYKAEKAAQTTKAA